MSKSSTGAGSCTYGPKEHTAHQLLAAAEYEYEVTTSQPASPAKPEPGHLLANSDTINDWSPLDDGIDLLCESTYTASSRKDVDTYIFNILYGFTAKRRLPAFAELYYEQ